MKLSRTFRFAAALVALFCLLFAQLAMAAYACPGLTAGQKTGMALMMTAEADQHRMPDCEEMDLEQPAMCHAHTQAGDHSLDKPAASHLPPVVAASLVGVVGNFDMAAVPPAASHADATWLQRSSDPPHSIRHCCFRL